MDKLKSVLSGKDDDEEQGIVTQVMSAKDLQIIQRNSGCIVTVDRVSVPPLLGVERFRGREVSLSWSFRC